jgi:hypothetical protein
MEKQYLKNKLINQAKKEEEVEEHQHYFITGSAKAWVEAKEEENNTSKLLPYIKKQDECGWWESDERWKNRTSGLHKEYQRKSNGRRYHETQSSIRWNKSVKRLGT